MTKVVKKSVLAIFILLVVIILAGCSTGFKPQRGDETYSPSPSSSTSPSSITYFNTPTNGLTQSNTDGEVTIDVEWDGEENNSLVFNVSMNTHSVDLDQYDLKELAVLRDDKGNEYYPVAWDSDSGGHHRKGTLTFILPDSVNREEVKYIEIMIRGIADIKERILKWEL